MNIAFDPWIPVITMLGKPALASLNEVFTDGEKFADLTVRPHERVSLMRLFICVAHAALGGPKNYDEWCDARKRLPDASRNYLEYWNKKESFELFHPKKPWLQIVNLKGVGEKGDSRRKTSPVSLLDFELATGNTATLHDHFGQMAYRPIALERVVLNLLTFQNFSPGGGLPVAQWNSTRTSQVGNPDAPCVSQSMAHCFLRGASLDETIVMNMPYYENLLKVYCCFSHKKKKDLYEDISIGRPVWESFPERPDNGSKEVFNATMTYIGRLVPISRWIRLLEGSDQMYCCNGFKYPTFKDGFAAEPTGCVKIVNKKHKKGAVTQERKVVGVHPFRAIWRELSSLLIKRHAAGTGGPVAMETAPREKGFDFQICAIIRDQASMDIAIESVFNISAGFKSNLPFYQSEVECAERFSRVLQKTIEIYRMNIDNDWLPRIKRTQAKNQSALKNRLAQVAHLSYWTTVENNLSLLMTHIESIGSDAAMPTRGAWRKMLFSTACESYKLACGRETPRHKRAFAMGWQELTKKQDNSNNQNNSTKEEEP